jgi:hypothetical protein
MWHGIMVLKETGRDSIILIALAILDISLPPFIIDSYTLI